MVDISKYFCLHRSAQLKMSATEIGNAFVQHYYTTFDSNRNALASLYVRCVHTLFKRFPFMMSIMFPVSYMYRWWCTFDVVGEQLDVDIWNRNVRRPRKNFGKIEQTSTNTTSCRNCRYSAVRQQQCYVDLRDGQVSGTWRQVMKQMRVVLCVLRLCCVFGLGALFSSPKFCSNDGWWLKPSHISILCYYVDR